jgi:murein DD-endopeptidase MepM/ murein hydrolase activator NlpD
MRWIKCLTCLFPVVLCMCLLVCALSSIPDSMIGRSGSEGNPAILQSGSHPPSGGSCANIGLDYPDNPFRGWPVERFPGDWSVISSWFCDPLYFRGFIHWGIDLAIQVKKAGSRYEYATLNGAAVLSTTAFAYVTAVANDGGPHYGMGNHVITKALKCHSRCGRRDEAEGDGQHLYLVEAQAEECLDTPPGCQDIDPSTCQDDLMMACSETGWKAGFFHLRDVAVRPGQLVHRNDVLGWIDNTGNSTGSHLHYQINAPGEGAIDPAPSMCNSYDDGLRTMYRWELPVCADIPGVKP